MTQTEITLLDSLMRWGYIVVAPHSIQHKTARKLCSRFGLIERETMSGGVVVYQYRLDPSGFHPMVFNNGNM